ncbi:MAG: hypothetical protein ACI9R3_003240 [Verrucomicrobiales bacterium]|jgi:hypothetical protein
MKARVQATKAACIAVREGGDTLLSATEETRLCARSRTTIDSLAEKPGDAAHFAAFSGSAIRPIGTNSPNGRLPLIVASVLAGSFVLGLATNYLGKDGVINLLAIPVFGLIAWNLVMYAIMLISPLVGRGGDGRGLLTDKVGAWMKNGLRTRAATMDQPYSSGAQKFIDQWVDLSAPAHWKAIRMVAHSSAILLAAGVLAGMYLRGLGYEYKAGWESTFLDAGGVANWLGVLLGPGSALTGIEIPPGELTIAQLDLASGSGEKADQWIHLFAANTALYIFVPRVLLIVWEFIGISRWRSQLAAAPVFASYYDKLAKDISGGDQLVKVLPFHCTPGPRHRDTVRGLIHQLWGGAAHVDFSDPAAYGDEDELLDGLESIPGYLVLLMSLSATPEGEAHGFVISELQKRMRDSGEDSHLLVVLDENRFRERFGTLPEFSRRLEERRSAWEELVKPLGLNLGYINSDDSESAEQLAASGDQLVWSSIDGGAGTAA